MPRHYSFESTFAQQSENSGFIDEPGIYTGKFTAAWYEQSRSGAEGIKFKFTADDGRQARNMVIYTYKGNGEKLPGYTLIQKIMACMRLKTLIPHTDTVELYDFQSRQMQHQTHEVYSGLCGAIGLVLTTEDYETRYAVKKQLIIYSVFNPETRLMASEIIKGNEKPAALDKVIHYLDSNDKWHKSLAHRIASPPTQPVAASNNSFINDDVPF